VSWGTGDRVKNQERIETDEQDGGHLNLHEARTENSVSDQKSQQAEQIHAGRERPWRQTWARLYRKEAETTRGTLSCRRAEETNPHGSKWKEMTSAETKTEELSLISKPKSKSKSGKTTTHMRSKNQFFIENHQEHNRFIEVTVLPHLIIEKKFVLDSLSET
jgi:hypothetical protein